MMPTQQGSVRLGRFAGVDLFLHWSWFIVAIFEINNRANRYSSLIWNVLEYVALFFIVLMHELGHSLACRSVGGKADQIVLWPLGGVAYVAPPPRPGATLWSIAAGPLVNVVLFPILSALWLTAEKLGWASVAPDTVGFIRAVWYINTGLLLFNILPIYPLDGGQILRSLLWFPFGRAKSLKIAAILGLVGVAGLLVLALTAGSVWGIILGVFIILNCWRGLNEARILARMAQLPRRNGFLCPTCQNAPPLGELWLCSNCQRPFDTFLTGAICPHCHAQFAMTRCMDCGNSSSITEWSAPPKL